ncbi:MAG: DUF6263 family protein [Ferruginibacter sp.]
MKQFLLCISLLASFTSFAQKNQNSTSLPVLQLNKGQQIIITTSSTMDAEMGMGMNMKNDVVQQNTLVVTDVNEKTYTVNNTLDRMRFLGSMAGQDVNFDSDKKEDLDTEIGKSVKDKIGKTIIATIDRITGKVSVQPKEIIDTKMEDNSLSGMLGGNQGNDEENVSSAFFMIPTGKKPGDSWMDSTAADKMKSVMEYKFISMEKDLATISIKTITSGTNTIEANGMQFDFSMNSKSSSEIIVNMKTSLVQKRAATADISGNIDMMGQSMDITSKASSNSEYK